MLKHGEANPLNVFGLRKLDHCPPHFVQIDFELYTTESIISNWIYENLSGRFYSSIVDKAVDQSTNFFRYYRVAFENHAEASYFSLFLSQINSPPY